MTKIFGIGLPRTGTTSLHKALQVFGMKSLHSPKELVVGSGFSSIDACDAAMDEPVAHMYKILDQRYPGSKFILTLRNVNEWLGSIEWLWSQWIKLGKYPVDLRDKVLRLRTELYGTTTFEPEVMRKAYEEHVRKARFHFLGRDDFLEMNICQGEGWEKLCPFLRKEIPESPFPRVHGRKEMIEKRTENRKIRKMGRRRENHGS